jgi:hypothetical protein
MLYNYNEATKTLLKIMGRHITNVIKITYCHNDVVVAETNFGARVNTNTDAFEKSIPLQWDKAIVTTRKWDGAWHDPEVIEIKPEDIGKKSLIIPEQFMKIVNGPNRERYILNIEAYRWKSKNKNNMIRFFISYFDPRKENGEKFATQPIKDTWAETKEKFSWDDLPAQEQNEVMQHRILYLPGNIMDDVLKIPPHTPERREAINTVMKKIISRNLKV